MNDEHDSATDPPGAVPRLAPDRSRITIRIDDDILAWFRHQASAEGTRKYQTMINEALREHTQRQPEPLEAALRRAIREELADYVGD